LTHFSALNISAQADRSDAVLDVSPGDSTPDVYIKLAALPVLDTRESIAILEVHHQKAFTKIFCEDVDADIITNLPDHETFAKVTATKSTETVQRSLSIMEAKKLLKVYQSMSKLFPFVVVPETETVQSMSRHSPFLLMAILSAACNQDMQLHNGLDHEFRRIMGSEIIAAGKKSLDFLQGLLVYTCWYDGIQIFLR
jgi:branched-subunit amino acid transport protein AzlD